jgi:hypothetical protein
LLASCLVFHAWLAPSALIASYDFPSFPDATIRGGALGWPHLWTDLFFGYSLMYWVQFIPYWALASLLHALGASYALVERLLWLWPLMFGAPLCGYYLCYRFTRNAYASAVGSLLFTINTWTIGLVERGHQPSLDAFMLMGFILPAVVDFTTRPSVRLGLLLALLVWFQMLFDMRYAFESVFVLMLVALFALPRLALKRRLPALWRGTAAFALAAIVLNLDFLLPVTFTAHTPVGFGSINAFQSVAGWATLLSAFSLYYPFYHFGTLPVLSSPALGAFETTPVEAPFLLAAFFAWFGFLVTGRRGSSRTMMLLGILAVGIVSGTRSRFEHLTVALYLHFPGFSMFRDVSKFNAVVVSVYAVGTALAMVAVLAYVRLRWPIARRASLPLTVIALLAYLFVVRDAFNPLRQANFAREPRLSASAQTAQRFFGARLGDARVLYFPADDRWNYGDSPLGIADDEWMARNAPPEGFALFNPAICCSWSDSLISPLASPLEPALLSELRVKYIYVPGDPSTYPHDQPQRWAAVDFLRQRNWLREVAHFGDDVIFELKQPPVEPAFFAAYPALVIGSPATLEGLVGTPLWSNHAAALISDQMPSGANWLASIPNVVEGSTLLDPDYPLGPGGPAAQAARLADALYHERYRRRAYSAYEFSSSMLAASLDAWNPGAPFSFRFQVPSAGPANFSVLLESRKERPSVLIRNSGQARAISSAGAQVAVSHYLCSRGQVWQQQFDPTIDRLSVADADAGKVLFVNNPCPVSYQASVTVRVSSAGVLAGPFSITYGNVSREFSAPPAIFAPFGAGSVVLADVLLRPGLNLFQFNKPAAGALWIDSAYTISDLNEVGPASQAYSLALNVRRSPLGELIYASIDAPRPGLHVGYLDLFGPLQLPFDEHPLCALKYTASNAAAGLALVLDLRKRDDGSNVSVWVPVASRQDADLDLRDVLESVFVQQASNALAYHAGDSPWVERHFKYPSSTPDDYTLRRVRLAVTWSVSQSDVPRGTFIGLLRGARLATDSPLIGRSWAYRQTSPVRTSGMSAKSLVLRGMKLLRFDNVEGGSEPHIGAQLSGFPLLDYRLAASLHVGDYVELVLQSGRRLAGTIVSESSDYVVLQAGDDPPQRVARGSIASVTRQDVTRSARVEIPIAAPFDPTDLSFDVRSDEGLRVRVALTYEAPDGSRETIPAVDSAASDVAGLDVESGFVKPRFLVGGGSVFDLGLPVDVSLAQTDWWSGYDLDLWSIEDYRFAGLRRRLVGLTVDFTQVRSDQPPDRQYSIAIANLKVERDRLASRGVVQSTRSLPLLTLDARALSPAHPRATDSQQYVTERSDVLQLDSGVHLVATLPDDQVDIRAALLSRGSPARYDGGKVTRFNQFTPSEATGSFEGAGLLVIPHSFDIGWQLAVWPAGTNQPALTGVSLVDWVRCLGHLLPSNDHAPVNTNIDAWYIPPGSGGERGFTTLYLPEALSQLGFVLTLASVLLFASLWRRWAR